MTQKLMLAAVLPVLGASARVVQWPAADITAGQAVLEDGTSPMTESRRILAAQEPLTAGNVPSVIRLPLEQPYIFESSFFVNLGVGSPPQNLKFWIDISTPEIAVSATDCEWCCRRQDRFDRALSGTYHGTDAALDIFYEWFRFSGNESSDSIQIGDLLVPNQAFVDASLLAFFEEIDFDEKCRPHILGLAPSGLVSHLQGQPLLPDMAQRQLLEKNVFGLRLLPPMELSLGDVNKELFDGDFIRVPLTNTPWEEFAGQWQTDASYVALNDGQGVRYSLNGLTAVFHTHSQWSYLPEEVAMNLTRELGFQADIPFVPPYVNCDQRDLMPSITFNLAGQNLTLSAYNYTAEWAVEGGSLCITTLAPSPLPPGDTTQVLLGTAFLQIFYSVFDLDTRTIGFARLAD